MTDKTSSFPVAPVLLFAVVTAGTLHNLVFRGMCFCLEATQDLGLNHLLSLFQLFFWKDDIFYSVSEHQTPPHLFMYYCCMSGKSHLGAEEISFEARRVMTRGRLRPPPCQQWPGLERCNENTHSLFSY